MWAHGGEMPKLCQQRPAGFNFPIQRTQERDLGWSGCSRAAEILPFPFLMLSGAPSPPCPPTPARDFSAPRLSHL